MIDKKKMRICLTNRQPTLHRHSMPGVEIVPSQSFDDDTIRLNPLMLEPLNADHDGDSVFCNVLVYLKKDDFLPIRIHISEFKDVFRLKLVDRYTKDNGTIVTNYRVDSDVYTYAINCDNMSEIKLKRITHWSIHENIKMYRIYSNSYDIDFYASDDHSLVIYNNESKTLSRTSPRILKESKNINNLFFVKNNLKNQPNIPINNILNYELPISDRDFGYFIGSWIRSGFFTDGEKLLISVEKDMASKIEDVLYHIGNNQKIVEFIIKNFSYRRYRLNQLPLWILWTSKDFLSGIISGFIDMSPVSITGKNILISHSNSDVIDGIVSILKYVFNQSLLVNNNNIIINLSTFYASLYPNLILENKHNINAFKEGEKFAKSIELNTNISLIPCSYFEFIESNLNLGYDFTVQDYKTFTDDNGLFLYDTMAIYQFHDKKSIEEVRNNAFLANYVNYDQNNDFLSTLRHESLFSAFSLTENIYSESNKYEFEIEKLNDLEESIELYNKIATPVKFKDKIYTYGALLFNKMCGFDDVVIDFTISSKNRQDLSRILYEYYNKDSKKFYDVLCDLSKKLFFFITISNSVPSIDIQELSDLHDEERQLINKLPDNHPILGYIIHQSIIERYLDKIDKNSRLYKLFISGTRFNKTQLARTSVSIGYTANAENIVDPKPICSNLMDGISEDEFFRSSFGTRKGLRDKYFATPASGYLERTMVMALSPIEIVEDDCGDSDGFEILIFSENHAKTLVGKYYRPLNQDDWKILDLETAKNLINQKVMFRSPMSCKTKNFKICKKCFGHKADLKSKFVGIISGQVLVERITQLIMRTFHTSGSANLKADKDLITYFSKSLKSILNNSENILLILNKTKEFQKILSKIKEIPGFNHSEEKDNEIIVSFYPYTDKTVNLDAVEILNKINEILKIKRTAIRTPNEYYQEFMSYLIEMGTIFSSYTEILFAHMFLTNEDDPTTFWRYDKGNKIVTKVGIKQLAKKISPKLGFLYQPNRGTINEEVERIKSQLSSENNSIHEKIWTGMI